MSCYSESQRPSAMRKAGLGCVSPSTPLLTTGSPPTTGQRQFLRGGVQSLLSPKDHCPTDLYSWCPLCAQRMEPDHEAFTAPGVRCVAGLWSKSVTPQGQPGAGGGQALATPKEPAAATAQGTSVGAWTN